MQIKGNEVADEEATDLAHASGSDSHTTLLEEERSETTKRAFLVLIFGRVRGKLAQENQKNGREGEGGNPREDEKMECS